MSLEQAVIGKVYKIISIAGEYKMRRKLLDMGLTQGTEIFVAAIAPLKGTVLVAVRGTIIAVRSDAAALVLVGA